MQKDIWRLQSQAQALLPHEPVAQCMRERDPRSYSRHVNIVYCPEMNLAYYGHLRICGSVWSCPVCASLILEYRRDELTDALRYWTASGGSVLMASFTVSYEKGEPLIAIINPLEVAMKHLRQGRSAQVLKENFGVIGTISKREIIYTETGWQPCIRLLIFFENKFRDAVNKVDAFFEEDFGRIIASDEMMNASAYEYILRSRWQKVARLIGNPSYEFNISFEKDFGRIVNFVTDFNEELIAFRQISNETNIIADSKELTPFAMLNLVTRGDHRFEELFREYARCYKGKRLIAWSKYLRNAAGFASGVGLNPNFVTKSDFEVVYEEVNDSSRKVIATLTWEQWQMVLAKEKRGELLEVAKLNRWTDTFRFLVALYENQDI